MEATFDYPYYKDGTNGFEIISLPYEHDGKNYIYIRIHPLLFNLLITLESMWVFKSNWHFDINWEREKTVLFSEKNEDISEAHMFLILPSKEGKQEFEMLERKLLNLNFPDIFVRMGVVFGDILLPRMELKFSTNLGSFLSSIGIFHDRIKIFTELCIHRNF